MKRDIIQPATATDLWLAMLVGLKITHQIDWSWWWVWSPAWISAIVVAVVAFWKGWKS